MGTEKDRECVNAIHNACEWGSFTTADKVLSDYSARIRAESAQQARKEIAENMCKNCQKDTPCEKNCKAVSDILGGSAPVPDVLQNVGNDVQVPTERNDPFPDAGKMIELIKEMRKSLCDAGAFNADCSCPGCVKFRETRKALLEKSKEFAE